MKIKELKAPRKRKTPVYNIAKMSTWEIAQVYDAYKQSKGSKAFWDKFYAKLTGKPWVKYKRPDHLPPLDLKALEGEWLRVLSTHHTQKLTALILWFKFRAKLRRIWMWRKIARVKNDVRGNLANPYVINTTPPSKYLVARIVTDEPKNVKAA